MTQKIEWAPTELPDTRSIEYEAATIWLRLGTVFRNFIFEAESWVDDEKGAETAIFMAEKAEFCLSKGKEILARIDTPTA